MKRKVIVLLLSHGLCLNANFINGNQYLELPEEARLFYVLGLFDMYIKNLFVDFYETGLFEEFIAKTEDMTGKQIRKIYDKYLAEYPEKLHQPAANLFDSAMTELLHIE